eukprot:502874-Lingulodinium_polyedra.AAC.1
MNSKQEPRNKAKLIQAQVRDLAIATVMGQEARGLQRLFEANGFIVACSGATRGTLGCSIWINTSS